MLRSTSSRRSTGDTTVENLITFQREIILVVSIICSPSALVGFSFIFPRHSADMTSQGPDCWVFEGWRWVEGSLFGGPDRDLGKKEERVKSFV